MHGLMQKRCNSIALEMELHLFCIKPSIKYIFYTYTTVFLIVTQSSAEKSADI